MDPAVPGVTVPEARLRIDAGALLVDVREPVEWDAGHAPQASHVPLGAVLDAMDSFARDRPVLVICRSGNRSRGAVEAMRHFGVDAWNVEGGMRAWQTAGEPVVRNESSTGTVI